MPENCTGSSAACPPDSGEPDGDGDGVCDLLDHCPTIPDPTQADADDDGLGDACDPCTNIVPVFALRPKVKITKLTAPGHSKLKFTGIVTVPTSPPIDPASNGVRVLLEDATGAPMLDVSIPGKVGWKANAAKTAWRYRNRGGWQSLVSVRITSTRRKPGRLKFQVVGRKGTYPMSPGGVPVKGTIVIDAPFARTGQCGEALFPGRPAPACILKAAGRTLKCG